MFAKSKENAAALDNATAVFPTSLADLDTHSETPKLAIQTWETQAGTKVLFLPTQQLPMLDVRLTFNAGGARDGELAGLARLTNAMLDQGTEQLDVTALATAFENLGADLSLDSYRD